MNTWLSWLFRPAPEQLPEAGEDLRSLQKRRQALQEALSSLRAYGFDPTATDDARALKALERRIFALRHKRDSAGGTPLLH